jgi:hypothetical protein
MTTEEMDQLAQVVVRALRESPDASSGEHYHHHEWITEQIQKVKVQKEFWKRLTDHIAIWGALGVVSVVFYALWLYLKKVLSE